MGTHAQARCQLLTRLLISVDSLLSRAVGEQRRISMVSRPVYVVKSHNAASFRRSFKRLKTYSSLIIMPRSHRLEIAYTQARIYVRGGFSPKGIVPDYSSRVRARASVCVCFITSVVCLETTLRCFLFCGHKADEQSEGHWRWSARWNVPPSHLLKFHIREAI